MMKLTLLLTILSFKSFATTYYVSNAGSNSNNGTSTGTSWQTLSKVNGFTFVSGDSVLFKCGDTWIERLLPKSNVHFASYGTGVRPLITGFKTASLSAPSSNIYGATITDAPNNLSVVKVNGYLRGKARFPNTGYSTFISYSGDSIINTSLTGTPDYTGKEIVIRTTSWGVNIATVSNQSTGALKVSPKLFTTPIYNTNGYFFQNDQTFLDTANEWCMNSTSFKVYSPTLPTVEYSSIDTLVYCSNKTNVTFNNINFSGGNTVAFMLDTCTNISITNCTLSECTSGITGVKTTYTILTYDTVRNMLQYGIALSTTAALTNPSSYTTIRNCYFKNTGNIIGTVNATWRGTNGSATNYWQTPHAMFLHGTRNLVEYNTIDSSGYIPIFFTGDTTNIKHNYITNYCYNFDDGGGIYTKLGFSGVDYLSNFADTIRGNIIGNGFRNTSGTNGSYQSYAHGIYLDDNFQGAALVDSNTVFNVTGYGLSMRTARVVKLYNNTFDDSLNYNYNFSGNQFQTYQLDFKRNIYYQRTSTNYISVTGSLASYTYTSDSNYVLRPTAPNGLLRYNSTDYSLSGYATATGYETHSHSMPSVGLLNNVGTLFYNPTQSDSTVTATHTYIDLDGNSILTNQTFMLRPFTSRLLFRYQYELTTSSKLLRF